MPIEKAFAIHAEPARIWRALTEELQAADPGAYEIERSDPPSLLTVRVQVQGGVTARITYRLIPRPEHTEVVATMEPEGVGYGFFRLITLGRSDTGYEMALVQGLANLKQVAEGKGREAAEPPA
jgi:carbon monoxide dehydrogenase subunit G